MHDGAGDGNAAATVPITLDAFGLAGTAGLGDATSSRCDGASRAFVVDER